MQITGYEEFEEDLEEWDTQIYLSEEVRDFFNDEGRRGNRNERPVRKVKITLKNLKLYGLERVICTAQFKRQDKFPSGRPSGEEQVVYEAKDDQVRIYGGPVTENGKTVFYFVEAEQKKTDKADRKQLARVAKRLGSIQHDIENREKKQLGGRQRSP